jgi:hypothetical protein
MGPLRNYKLLDGTTRQYREGEQPEGAVVVEVRSNVQTPESRASKAPAKAAAKRGAARKSTASKDVSE